MIVPPDQIKLALKKLGSMAYPDQIGIDSNHDGIYGGKSLKLGEGGRTIMLTHKIAKGLVEKGMKLKEALVKAKQIAVKHGIKKYGAKKMLSWAGR